MAKKNRVKMWCQKCWKNTIHETRIVDEKETHICLKCEVPPVEFTEEHAGQHLQDEFKYPLSGTVQPKRISETARDRMPPMF